LPNGESVRAHPNFGNSGPIYDFVLVPGKNIQPHTKSKKRNHKKRPYDRNEPHFHDRYPFHVPARVISFFTDPDDGIDKAFVHQCEERTEWNKLNDSVLSESWTLETQTDNYYIADDGKYHQDRQRHI
jgi:hypothetical protein